MDSEEVKLLISEFISLRDDLTRLGGAEEAPVLWGECVKLRSTILKHFALPETNDIYRLFTMPKMPETETLGFSLLGSEVDQQKKDALPLADILGQAGIISSDDPRMIEHKKRRVVKRMYERFYMTARFLLRSNPLTPFEIMANGKAIKVTASDLLLQLGFFNEPYQRFLIAVILYGGYGTMEQVLNDLIGAQELNNIWALSEYYSDSLEEKQLGTENLRVSGLRFIDIFLWWEKDVNILNSIKSFNNDDN